MKRKTEVRCKKYDIGITTFLLFILTSYFLLPTSFSYAASFGPELHTKWVTKLKKEKTITKRPYQFAVPVYSDGKIYVGTASGYFYQLDAENGHKDWKAKLSGGIYSEPVVDGGSIYLADRKGMVYSLEKATGKIEWQVDTAAEISSKPVVTEDTLYFSTALRQIVAVSKNGTGKRWQTTKVGTLPPMVFKGTSSPILYNGNIYVGYSDGTISCYKASDGSPVWSKQLANRESIFVDVDATPLIDDGVLYMPTSDGKTFALDPSDGSVKWKTDKGGPNDMANDADNIYVSGNGKLAALRKDTGVVVWLQDLQEPEVSAPVLKDGYIALVSTSEKLYVLDAANGEIKYKRFFGKGSFNKPVIVDNNLYLFTNSSKLFALQAR